jgi:hypothetical protein
MPTPSETAVELLDRLGALPDCPLTVVRLAETRPDGTSEASRILAYLAGLGHPVRRLSDLVRTLDALPDEEELSAHRVREGVLVSHASDGWFILFRP